MIAFTTIPLVHFQLYIRSNCLAHFANRAFMTNGKMALEQPRETASRNRGKPADTACRIIGQRPKRNFQAVRISHANGNSTTVHRRHTI
jgi:hypothetical protein